MQNKKGLFTLLLWSAMFATISIGCKDSTTDSTDDTHSEECAHWSYTGDEGPAPEHWKDCTNNVDCGGEVQSPVNITGATAEASLQDVIFAYDSSKTAIVNNGHTLQWGYDSGSAIIFNGATYDLQQFHFHTSSEHTINGTSYPMEVHLVHKNLSTGKLAVIGIFFNEGAENVLLQQFLDHLPTSKDATYENAMKFIASDLMPTNSSYYTYSGSLTTPPCSEVVTWIVMKTPIEASKAQIDRMHELMHSNNRPLQPLNGRHIQIHE